MKCPTCKHDFCWICLGDWKEHGSSWYKCFREEKLEQDSSFVEEKKKGHDAKNELARYSAHFEMFMNHEKSEKIATKQLKLMDKTIETLHDVMNYPVNEVDFLLGAT